MKFTSLVCSQERWSRVSTLMMSKSRQSWFVKTGWSLAV